MKKISLVLGVVLVVLGYRAIAQERLIEGLRIARACTDDIVHLCKGVVPGRGRIKACVTGKLTELSPQCFDAFITAIGADKKPPDYAASSNVKRFDQLRGMRYCEVFLIGADLSTESLYADFFNTTDLNNTSDPQDTCPASMWAKVNPKPLARQHGVLSVFKNGPRGWVMDWIELPAGEIQTFDGLQARWMGHVELPKGIDLSKKGSSAYRPTQVHRKSVMTFEKGKPVFILDDPSGMPWVMQAYSDIVDPNLKYDDLTRLGDKLKLAPGWKFRTKVLDQDLTIRAVNGVARIVQDDLENTYDACFEMACTYKL